MGVCDDTATVFVEDGPTLVSTHDATTVNAFLATIGAPYTALQQYGSYRRQYQAARRSRPLHVLPQFQTEDEEARLAFALAAVFGMIFSRGFYYYYRPEDALESPLKLGHGLANAIHHFARADTLTREVMGRVERRVEEIGTMVRSLRRLPDRDALHRLALGAVFLAPRPEEEAEAPSQEKEGTDRTDRRPRLTAADLLSFDDGCYLLDRVNAEGLLLAAEEGRSRLVARWLALRALTGLGAALDRMPASLAMDDPAARFDTFGVAAWAFPVASLRDHLAHRWQIEALRSLLAPFEGDRAGADAFLERQGWPPSPWPEGGTIRFRAAGREAWSTPSLRQIRTLREAIDDAVEAEQQRLRESMGQAERSLEASSSGLVAALAEEVDGLLDDHGLGLTAAFLDQLEEVAQARVTRLEKEAERCAARLAELDGRADDAARALDDLIAQFPPPRLRAALGLLLRPWRLLRLWLLYGEIEPLVGAYLSYRQSQWLLQAEGFERQWRAALVARLAQAARDEKEAVARLRTALERLRERLLGERTSASRPALERQLEAAALPGRLIDRFYEKVADDEGVKPTGLLITHGPLSRWVREGWAGETLDLILEEHAREQFAFLDWVRLDDLLARTRSGAELRDRLTALVEAAAPWWAWDESALSAAERSACRRLLLVGLPDAESSLLVDLLPDRPHTCFSTGDRRRIVAIQVVQGLPLEVANEGG